MNSMSHRLNAPSRSRMEGRICLIVGGTSGIGRSVAEQMAREGADAVIVAGRRQYLGEEVVACCRKHGAVAEFIAADAACDADVRALHAAISERFGRLDVAFNNAGKQERPRPLHEQGDATFTDVINGNVRSVFLCLKYQAEMMMDGGGTIVLNASVSGVRNAIPGISLYAASKAAVISMTRSAAMEYAPHGIRINAIAPGRVKTNMLISSGADVEAMGRGLPLGRTGRPEEAAEVVTWLASGDSSYVVGHILNADGGFLAS